MEWFRTPFGGVLLWIVLHAADYLLTIWGAVERERRAAHVIMLDGSYELNPLFQKSVNERRWVSARFLITLVGVAALIGCMNAVVGAQPGAQAPQEVFIGALLFTRVALISRHLQNIWLFRRMAEHPESVVGQLRYERRTVVLVSAFQAAGISALVVLAAVLSPTPALIGGALGLSLLTVLNLALAFKRRPAAEVSG
jgi:hypothetical protein